MTAKEYREKEQITDANFWDGDEIDFNMVYEFAEDYHKKQLSIHIVSQQRELLIAFLEMNNWLSLEDEENAKGVVDCYLKAINCG